MSHLEEGIKCKYCSFFESGANYCHLGSNFDSQINPDPGCYCMGKTTPDSRCSHFTLPALDGMAYCSGISIRPKDGSPLVLLKDVPELEQQLKQARKENTDCYIATCVYGSYDCPQVWTLRRFRDNQLASTWYGRTFIQVYYAISPTLVNWFGHTAWFQKFWKQRLDQLVTRLHQEGISDTPYTNKEGKRKL